MGGSPGSGVGDQCSSSLWAMAMRKIETVFLDHLAAPFFLVFFGLGLRIGSLIAAFHSDRIAIASVPCPQATEFLGDGSKERNFLAD